MTKDELRNLFCTDNLAVEKAIVILYNRQTASEQQVGDAIEHNNQGFAAFNAKSGTYYAKWILSGRHLTGNFLVKARKIACWHAKQLADAFVSPKASTAAPRMVHRHYSGPSLATLITQHDPFQAI